LRRAYCYTVAYASVDTLVSVIVKKTKGEDDEDSMKTLADLIQSPTTDQDLLRSPYANKELVNAMISKMSMSSGAKSSINRLAACRFFWFVTRADENAVAMCKNAVLMLASIDVIKSY
jgi:hypothetical protein